MTFLSGEKDFFEISLGTDTFISVSSSPLVFLSPVTYINSRDAMVETKVEDESLSDDEDYDEELDYDVSEEDEL